MYKDTIANLIPLSENMNERLGNKLYIDKINIYGNTLTLKMTKN